MAIWQFSFYLTDNSDSDQVQVINVQEESLKNISNIFPLGESWHKDLVVYGNNDKTCIILSYENNILQEVLIKIDLRSATKNELIMIVEFIKANNLKIVCDTMIYEPTIKKIIELIKKSNAYKFCENPQEFLNAK